MKKEQIIFNQATSMAYVMLRKYTHHHNNIKRELRGNTGASLENILKSYAKERNDSSFSGKPFCDFNNIDFAKIARWYNANLPINNDFILASKYSIKSNRYSMD